MKYSKNLTEVSFKSKREINTSSDKQYHREFLNSRTALQKNVKFFRKKKSDLGQKLGPHKERKNIRERINEG